MSQFFVATSILDVSQFVKLLRFMSLCYEILRNFDCSLEFFCSLDLIVVLSYDCSLELRVT